MHNAVQHIDEIFWQAAQLAPGEERDAYLVRACGGDQELRQRLERLLQVQPKIAGFLERPFASPEPLSATVDAMPAEGPGTPIGPYKLLEQIGEGGMGLVFMAEQTQPVRRRVALKVIKPGMDTRQVVGRFEAERQALALMEHPNIAKVFDGGATASGRPYFVMELVRGVPITEFCDQHRLTTRQRLELFVTVCQAVQHAHQKGIIHRDLKPSNVLVTLHDTVGVPKIIDFGIAKATTQPLTERTLFTHFAQMLGTPLYMSPEQAEMNGLDVDTRSDVYALGVLLYELLTGTTPFESETLKQVGLDEMRRMIREEEPPTPSQRLSTLAAQVCSTVSERRGMDSRRLGQVLRGELDWIVMRALEKDRNRRYESASAFAADVQRYLNDEAVAACPPSAGYRLRKFARRNRRPLVTAGVIVVTLVAATVVSTWQAVVARDAQHQAESDRKQAEADRKQAEADRERATEAKREAVAISNFLQEDLFLQLDFDRQRREGFTPNRDLTVKEALHRAAARIGGRFQDQPLVEAAIRYTIGYALQQVGEARQAVIHLERCVELRKAHLGWDHPDTVACVYLLAMSYQFSNRLSDTIALLEQVWEQRKATLGPDDENTLTVLNSLGEACRKAGRWEKAEQFIEKALKRREALKHPEAVNSMHDLGLVYRDMGRYDESVNLLERAWKQLEVLCGADHPNTLYCMENIARTYEKAGKFAQADNHYRDIIARTRKEDRSRIEGLTDRRVALSEKLLKQKKATEAETTLRESLAVYAKVNARPVKCSLCKSLLGEALMEKQQYAAAEPILLQAYEDMKKEEASIPTPNQHWLTEASERVAHFYQVTNQPEKAREWREKLKPAPHPGP